MAEVLHNNLKEIEASDIHQKLGLEKGKYILLSAHREENIDTEKNFLTILNNIYKMEEKLENLGEGEAVTAASLATLFGAGLLAGKSRKRI